MDLFVGALRTRMEQELNAPVWIYQESFDEGWLGHNPVYERSMENFLQRKYAKRGIDFVMTKYANWRPSMQHRNPNAPSSVSRVAVSAEIACSGSPRSCLLRCPPGRSDLADRHRGNSAVRADRDGRHHRNRQGFLFGGGSGCSAHPDEQRDRRCADHAFDVYRNLYVFQAVPVGTFTLRVQHEGFQSVVVDSLRCTYSRC
jgi:hypothetical protein